MIDALWEWSTAWDTSFWDSVSDDSVISIFSSISNSFDSVWTRVISIGRAGASVGSFTDSVLSIGWSKASQAGSFWSEGGSVGWYNNTNLGYRLFGPNDMVLYF